MSNTGAGSGITRALKFTPDIKLVNDETLNEFVVTVERRDVGETDVKNDRDSDREELQAQSYDNKWQFSIFIKKKIENSLHAYIESAINPVFIGVSPNFEPT